VQAMIKAAILMMLPLRKPLALSKLYSVYTVYTQKYIGLYRAIYKIV
jgi:hypothetical protein